MKLLAVITARGGSKRIPHKNIRPFNGKPILAYSIQAALESNLFNEVMVSTDDAEIACIAKAWGAKVPFMRSAENANDTATTVQALLEVVQEYEKQGKTFETLCCIYPTAPFVTARRLQQACALMTESVDSVMPVTAYGFPPQRAMIIKEGCLKYQYPEYQNARSQDLLRVYHDCGQFYFCRVESLISNKSLVGPRTVPIVVDEIEAQDIDSEVDWKLAELKYRLVQEEQSLEAE